MTFKTECRAIKGRRAFAVQKLHHGEWVDWVYIGQSTISGGGQGISAACNFATGEFIGRYLGRVLDLKTTFTDADTHHIDQQVDMVGSVACYAVSQYKRLEHCSFHNHPSACRLGTLA